MKKLVFTCDICGSNSVCLKIKYASPYHVYDQDFCSFKCARAWFEEQEKELSRLDVSGMGQCAMFKNDEGKQK